MGDRPSEARAAASATASVPPSDPVSASSAARARTGRSPAPHSAIRVAPTRPSSPRVTVAATPHTGRSPWRRATSTNAVPVPAVVTGTSTATTISPGASDVVNGPVKKSSASTVRSPERLRTTTRPSRASSAVGSSADGSANATLPTTVPRLRTGACATWAPASASRGACAATSGESSLVRCRTVAPSLSVPL